MSSSDNRILTTHAGSLPRPQALAELLGRKSRHEPVDEAALEQQIAESTKRVIARQLECGIDVGNNGEQSRESFFTYVQHRMSGFSGKSQRPFMSDLMRYPSYLAFIGRDYRKHAGRSDARAESHQRYSLHWARRGD